MWVLRTSLTSPASIAALVRSARENGFNTLLVQVRGRGDAYYRGGLEPLAPELLRQPATFDPLATVIEAAHAQASASTRGSISTSSPAPSPCPPPASTLSTAIPNG